jgi:hypothetical protein
MNLLAIITGIAEMLDIGIRCGLISRWSNQNSIVGKSGRIALNG